MRWGTVLLVFGVLLTSHGAVRADPQRPCDQAPPAGAPAYTEPFGNRFYAGSQVGIWGNSDWYLYVDSSGRVQGRGTVDNTGLYADGGRQCVVTFGYPVAGGSATPPAPATLVSATRCSDESWTAGTVDICAGELVYRDYVYDDYGADTGGSGSSTGALSTPTGDQRYPSEVNSADLLALRLKVSGGRLHVRFEMNSLFRSDSTVAALAIDTDDSLATGGGEWTGVGSPPVRSRGFDVLHVFRSGDPATNVIAGNVPLPRGRTWRVQAVTAQAGGPVMNVAFRGTAETGPWWENNQALALRLRDITPLGFTVPVGDLNPKVTRVQQVGPGFSERVYTSKYAIGEGVSYDGVPGRHPSTNYFAQEYHYLGRHQPYAVYVPGKPGPHGLQLVLHGFGANHHSLVGQAGFRRDFADLRNRILVSPLARGPAGHYSDWAERDVLDVLDDALRRYEVPADRVYVSGYSMGGYGTYRMAMLYPDRFAGFIVWVGGTGDAYNGTPMRGQGAVGTVGNVIDLVGNLRHVPGAMLYGGADELVWVSGALAMAEAFKAHANPYVFYMHPAAEHFTFAVADTFAKEAAYTGGLVRAPDPARVTFRTRAYLGSPELAIAHDRAYWVSSIRERGAAYADVDLTTSGCGRTLAITRPTQAAGPDPVPWTSEGAEVAGAAPVPAAASLTGTLTNVSSLTIDAARACVPANGATYKITTDGPATITLTSGRRAVLGGAGTHTGSIS